MSDASNPSNILHFTSKKTSHIEARLAATKKARSEIDPNGPNAQALIDFADRLIVGIENELRIARGKRGFRLHRNAKLEKRDQTNLVVLEDYRTPTVAVLNAKIDKLNDELSGENKPMKGSPRYKDIISKMAKALMQLSAAERAAHA